MDITHKLTINASPETVYNAVATKTGISGWWSKDCTVGETEGADSILNFDKQGTIVTMDFQTKTLLPNKKVVWACTKNGNPIWIGTQIVTEITPTDTGSSVVFSHANFDDKHAGQEGFEMTKMGWEHFVKSLVSYCENGNGEPW